MPFSRGRTAAEEPPRPFFPGAGDPGSEAVTTPRRTIELWLSNEVRRIYNVVLPFEHLEIVCVNPGADWDNASNLVTITKFVSATNLFHRRPASILRPDGTATLYFYATNAAANVITTVATGQPGNSALTDIVDGTTNITFTGNLGQAVSFTEFDIASGITLSSVTYTNYDDFNRPRQATFLDGTAELSDHGCCGPVNITNRDGSILIHGQDSLKRYDTTTATGITNRHLYDAANRLLARIRVGTTGGAIVEVTNTYDTAGRLLTSKDALGNTTSYSESADGLIRTNTYPDGSTRIEKYYRDGQLAEVSGTATHAVRYYHGVEQDGGVWRAYTIKVKVSQDDDDTNETIKTYRDMLGRPYKTVFAGGAVRQSFYNNKGQLVKEVDPDGVTTLYAYNALGERETAAIDMDRNGVIDTNGTDRIQMTRSTVTTKVVGSVTNHVRQTQSFVWAANNLAVSNLVTTVQTTTDGRTPWSSTFDVTNRTDTSFATNGNGAFYVTTTAPDGPFTVSYTLNGLLQSVTRYDANTNQLSAVTYTYDSYGRQKTATDARNGTTTYAYDNADHVTSTTTPAPGNGQSPQTTSYSYDPVGRVTRTVLPDGGSVTNIYHRTGELATNCGARAYPVAYTYDYAKRKKTMKTWKNFAAGSGAATTTWNYDEYRGHLTSKVYDNECGTTNTYTPAGRLQTRTWARGIVTTYHTNSAGQIFATTYSDGTTPAVTNYFDRLGRPTNILDVAGSRFLTYDSAGRLLMETNASGVLSNVALIHSFDWLGRRTNVKSQFNGSQILSHSYSFDTTSSRLTNVTDGTYNASYSYLANRPLVSQITHRSNSIVAMTTTKTYDYLNRLLSISSIPSAQSQDPIAYAYAYNDANHRIRRTDPDGSYWLYEYDKLGQLTSGKHYWSDHTPVAGQQYEYAYDDIGNRTSTKQGGDASGAGLRPASYSANALNQYTQRDVPGAADIMGIAHPNANVTNNGQLAYRKGEYFWSQLSISNSSAPVWTNVTTIASLSGTNQTNFGNLLHPKASETFTFDADGNQTSDTLWTNSWDGENRLLVTESGSAVPSGGKAKEAWTLDGQSRWVQRIIYTWNGSAYVASTTNRFLWDNKVLLAILDHSNGLAMSFLRGLDLGGSLQGAGGAGGVLAVNIPTNGFHFMAYDGNGNVVGLVTAAAAAGTTSARHEYDPFGNTTRATGPAAAINPLRFGTQYADDVTGHNNWLFRQESPSFGRWLSSDPSGEDRGLNLYSFVNNASMSSIDVFGLATKSNGDPLCERACETFVGEIEHGNPDLYRGGGACVCYASRKCPCLWDAPDGPPVGKCFALDFCGRQHEEGHCTSGKGHCLDPSTCLLTAVVIDDETDRKIEECLSWRKEKQCLEVAVAPAGCQKDIKDQIKRLDDRIKAEDVCKTPAGGGP